MKVLTDAVIALLKELPVRSEARRKICFIPLGSSYWEDEMPEAAALAKLTEVEQNMVWRMFGIRFKIWDGEDLTEEDGAFWDAARAEVPTWALFVRLSLSDDDRKARRSAEADVENGLAIFFDHADSVELVDKEHGLQEWSATFDLTKKPGS